MKHAISPLNLGLLQGGASMLANSGYRPINQGPATFGSALGQGAISGLDMYQKALQAQAPEWVTEEIKKGNQVERWQYDKKNPSNRKLLSSAPRWQARAKKERRIIKGLDGRNYYADDKSPVLPDVKATEDVGASKTYLRGNQFVTRTPAGKITVQDIPGLKGEGWTEPYTKDGQMVQRKEGGTNDGLIKALPANAVVKRDETIVATRETLDGLRIQWQQITNEEEAQELADRLLLSFSGGTLMNMIRQAKMRTSAEMEGEEEVAPEAPPPNEGFVISQ